MADNESCSWRAEYEMVEILSTYYGIYLVGRSGKKGVIRLHNNNVIEYASPIEYNEIMIFSKNNHLLLAQKSGKKRLIKVAKNDTFLSPYYDKVGTSITHVGLIQVAIGDLTGAIDTNLKEVIPVQYDMLDDCAFHSIEIGKWQHSVLIMKKENRWGILNTKGEVLLPFEYDKIDESIYRRVNLPQNKKSFVIIPNQVVSGSGLISVKKNRKWGLIDEVNFKEVVPCIYKSIRQNTPNKIELIKETGHDLLLMTKDGPQIQCFSTVKLEQYSKIGKFENGFAIVQKHEKYGFIDEDYNEVIPCTYEDLSMFINGVAIVKKNGKCGFIDEKGNELAPCVYDEVLQFHHGIAIVRIGEYFGAINEKGSIIIPIEYLILADISYIGPVMLMALKNRLFGVIDKKNNVIVPFEYDNVLPMLGMITVTKHKKKGVFNHKGQQVVPIQYDDIQHPSSTSSSINVCKEGKWGVLNKKGQVICQPKYDAIDGLGFYCGRLSVCRNGKWGFINRNGREVIECIYDKVYQFFEENHCEVKLDGVKITIDTHGNKI